MKQQFDMNFMNRYTGELLTKEEMITQWREEFDGDDDTNLTPYTEHYIPVFYHEGRWFYVVNEFIDYYLCEYYDGHIKRKCYFLKESVKNGALQRG